MRPGASLAIVVVTIGCTPHPQPPEPHVAFDDTDASWDSPARETEWATSIGRAGVQRPRDMVVDGEGATFVLADVSHGCTEVTLPSVERLCPEGNLGGQVLVKHDRFGELEFVRRVDDRERWWIRDMTLVADGGLALLAGPRPQLWGEPAVAPEHRRPRVQRIDRTDGRIVDTFEIAIEGTPGVHSFAGMPNGDLVVGGEFAGELRVGGRVVRSPAHDEQEWDLFVARVDGSGQVTWSSTARGQTRGPSGQDTLAALRVHHDGTIVVTGGCRGRPLRFESGGREIAIECGGRQRDDGFVAKWSSAGVLKWVRRIDGTMSGSEWSSLGATPKALAVAPTGDVVVAGIFSHELVLADDRGRRRELHGRGFADVFVARFDSSGDLEDAWHIGGPGQDDITDLLAHEDAWWLAVVVAGEGVLAGDWTRSSKFTGHEPANLHLGERGALVRLDAATWESAHVELAHAEPVRMAAAFHGLRIAGSFDVEATTVPLASGDTQTLRRRVGPRDTYEPFLWGATWHALARGLLLHPRV